MWIVFTKITIIQSFSKLAKGEVLNTSSILSANPPALRLFGSLAIMLVGFPAANGHFITKIEKKLQHLGSVARVLLFKY